MLKKFGIPAIVTIVLDGLYYYFALPPLNFKSGEFWFFLFLLAAISILTRLALIGRIKLNNLFNGQKTEIYVPPKRKMSKRAKKLLLVALGVFVLAVGVIFVTSSKMFNASKYQRMLTVKNSSFSEDIAEIPISQIPVVDRDTATRLGSRKIGEVVELVSQFNVADYYTQINFKQSPVRVSPLEYADFLKWLGNRNKGVPYYVKIDMATQNTDLVELEKGMKYLPSEYFGRDLMRHVRFRYPTKMFHSTSFEIDDDLNPFWIISYYDYTIGLLGGKDITGIIAVDAITGQTFDYKINEIPSWIDRVYEPDIILQQAKYWGAYTGGYLNSIFGQKNVIQTSEGYNYIAFDDDVWLYTGITSVVQDESNIGFIIVNTRTKEARRYSINGAEEFSAMESAEGKIQEKGYTATFPILVNIADMPSYFISLKDNAGLVKAYSFVSVSNYQIVGVADTIDGAAQEYIRLLKDQGLIGEDKGKQDDTAAELTLMIENISSAVVDGNSVYYIKARDDNNIYTAKISISRRLPLLKTGDTIKAKVNGNTNELIEILD